MKQKMIESVVPLSSIQVLDNGDVASANRRKEVYFYIAGYVEQNGYSPSIREIVDGLSLSSTSVAAWHLKKLKEAGCVVYDSHKARTIIPIHPPIDGAPTSDEPTTCAVLGCAEPCWHGPRGLNMALTKCEHHQREEWRSAKARKRDQNEPAQPRKPTAVKSIEGDDLEKRLQREVRAHAETKRALKQVQDEMERLQREAADRAAIRSRVRPFDVPPKDEKDGSEAML